MDYDIIFNDNVDASCLDKYLCNYDNIVLIGDFNSEIDEKAISEFCDLYNLQSLIK